MDKKREFLLYEVALRHNRGESQRGISRALGISRQTVKKYIALNSTRREEGESSLERELPQPRAPRASKLDEYEKQMKFWLDEYPDLTAVRLKEKLEQLGYQGGYTIVRKWLKKERKLRNKITKKARLVVETAVGQQGQFDWSPYKIENDIKVQVWSYILSWSRGHSFKATDNTTQTTILRCLQDSFEALQGVPSQLVTDSMPGVVDRWECGRPILNARFVDFAAYYECCVNIAPRGDGAYKGKVERPFWYLESNLLNGRKIHSLEEFQDLLLWWNHNKAMQRPHPVTKSPIAQMHQEEIPYLKPLPLKPYDTRDVVFRLVDVYGYVHYETNFYPVAEKHIGEVVYICAGREKIEIFNSGVHRLAEHQRQLEGQGIRLPANRIRKGRYDITLLTKRMAAFGQAAEDFAHQLRQHKKRAGPQLNHIVGLQLIWSADDIVKAIEHAVRYNAYDAKAIERILQARFKPRSLNQQIADSARSHLAEVMREHVVQIRPLQAYATLRTGDQEINHRKEETDESENSVI